MTSESWIDLKDDARVPPKKHQDFKWLKKKKKNFENSELFTATCLKIYVDT